METRQPNPDLIGHVAVLLPFVAVSLHLAGTFLIPASTPSIGMAFVFVSFAVLFTSVPFAGVVAFRARRVNRRRMKRGIFGLILGTIFSVLFVIGTMAANAKARAVQDWLETSKTEAR